MIGRGLRTAPGKTDCLILDPMWISGENSFTPADAFTVHPQAKAPVIEGSHDPLDAVVLADDIVVLEDGRVTQRGSVDDVSRRPASPYAAALMGVNLLHGEAGDGIVRTVGGGSIAIADHGLSGEVVVVIRPEAISLHSHRPEGSPRNVWPVTVRELEPRMDRTLIHLSGQPDLVAAVTPTVVTELGIEPGGILWASAKALDLDAYARPTAPPGTVFVT